MAADRSDAFCVCSIVSDIRYDISTKWLPVAEMADTSRRMKVRGNVADAFGLCHCILLQVLYVAYNNRLSIGLRSHHAGAIQSGFYKCSSRSMIRIEGLWSVKYTL